MNYLELLIPSFTTGIVAPIGAWIVILSVIAKLTEGVRRVSRPKVMKCPLAAAGLILFIVGGLAWRFSVPAPILVPPYFAVFVLVMVLVHFAVEGLD